MTVAFLLGAAEARSQNFFNIALLSRVLHAACQATVGQGEDGLVQRACLGGVYVGSRSNRRGQNSASPRRCPCLEPPPRPGPLMVAG